MGDSVDELVQRENLAIQVMMDDRVGMGRMACAFDDSIKHNNLEWALLHQPLQ